ncbi:MAG TPA: ComEC/Rec2 family competence protein [Clostridia bacterium]|nr:MAG: ComEC family competence protein [Firmicutes bacterium ADurb.Bin146]HOD93738.1 ComEC/Rec2 family competence protein [Clostridia bacterium]
MYGNKSIKNYKWRNQYIYIIILVLLALSIFLVNKLIESLNIYKSSNEFIQEDSMQVHFIDVGQGDCILLQDSEHNILIDTGSVNMSKKVLRFLKDHNVDTIDMVVLTHPHEDHIGSFKDISEKYDIDLVLKSPVIRDNYTYKNTEKEIQTKGITSLIPLYGEIFRYGEMIFTILTDANLKYEEINNYSIALKLDHMGNTFIFTGDLESEAEHNILDNRMDIDCDVLKIAHHGGSSSTTSEFLYKTSPIYAIIQLGTDNDYGYPHKTIISRLKVHNINTYRTDLSGDITVVSTEEGLSFKFEKEVNDIAD